MKNIFLPSLKTYTGTLYDYMFSDCILCLSAALLRLAPGRGEGETVSVNGKVVGYK